MTRYDWRTPNYPGEHRPNPRNQLRRIYGLAGAHDCDKDEILKLAEAARKVSAHKAGCITAEQARGRRRSRG